LSRRNRRQRVAFRFKRREQLKHDVRTVLVRTVAVSLIVGFGAGLVTGGNSYGARFIRNHTPQVVLNSPKALAGIPVFAQLPANRFWLWVPGSGYWYEKRVCRTYAAVRAVRLERLTQANRIVVHLDPRVPLVTWNGSGFDRDGILFAITPGTWNAMPQASFLAGARKADLGKWLARLNASTEVWSQVASIKQDASETLEITLKSGTVVIWGTPEAEPITRKAQTLARILDDAHKNFGGSSRADLRFFDQGRIIVRPKGK
jgi:hypothetical protein